MPIPVLEILNGDNEEEKKALFLFNKDTSDDKVFVKFNLWARYFFPKYFKSKDADFHEEMDRLNIEVYRGKLAQFVNVAFRGAAKTARTKLILAFFIANDRDHHRRYIRCLGADLANVKQSVTDIFNMLIQPKVERMYPEIFAKTGAKREETMSSFTTSTGVKLISKQIGVDQRGNIQEDAKADFDWYDDFETRSTIRSAVTTHKIAENMEEARTGLALGGGSIYTCNYISEMGNVHTLIKKESSSKKVLIVPIMDEKNNPTWDRYSKEDIEAMKKDDEDFEGERMCRPSASKDIYFDREMLDKQKSILPIRDIAGFKIFKEYRAHHRYGSGHDVAGGVGLDSSTSVFIDFDTIPAQVVATFKSNTIQPESFGDEIYSEGCKFGLCIQAVENNKFDSAVLKAKQLGSNLYMTRSGKEIKAGYRPPAQYGWSTNSLTKSQMLSAMKGVIEDGLLDLNDVDLIEEFRSYTRNDLIDSEPDPRLSTRHFDLLIACCIAWQMKDHAKAKGRDPSLPSIRPAVTGPRKNPAL